MKRAVVCGWMLPLCLLALPACQRQDTSSTPADDSEVVARVGSVTITLEQFEKYLNSQNRLVRSRYTSLEQKKRLLDSLVEREAMVLEAKRLGLDKDPEVEQGFKKILARHLVNKVFNKDKAKKIEVSDAEIEQYYKQNEQRYHAPEKVRVHTIFFKGEDAKSRAGARARAKKVLAELRANPSDRRLFIQKARQLSEDEKLKNSAGDTGFKTKEELEKTYGKAFAEAAFALKKVNDLSEPVETPRGVYLLRQSGRQPRVDLPLEKVKEQIRTTLITRKKADAYRAFVEEIKRQAGVKVFEQALAKAKVDLSDVPRPGKRPVRPALQPLRRIQPLKKGQQPKAPRPAPAPAR